MKRIMVVFVLLAGITAVAFASFTKSNKKVQTEKKTEKKECKRKCLFS